MRQTALAERAGLTASWISKIESGTADLGHGPQTRGRLGGLDGGAGRGGRPLRGGDRQLSERTRLLETQPRIQSPAEWSTGNALPRALPVRAHLGGGTVGADEDALGGSDDRGGLRRGPADRPRRPLLLGAALAGRRSF